MKFLVGDLAERREMLVWHEENGYGTEFGRERMRNRGSSGRTGMILVPDNSLTE